MSHLVCEYILFSTNFIRTARTFLKIRLMYPLKKDSTHLKKSKFYKATIKGNIIGKPEFVDTTSSVLASVVTVETAVEDKGTVIGNETFEDEGGVVAVDVANDVWSESVNVKHEMPKLTHDS